MNQLPAERSALTGRTWPSSYRREHYAPITGPWRRIATWERIAGVLLATAIGVGLAAWAVAWWSA